MGEPRTGARRGAQDARVPKHILLPQPIAELIDGMARDQRRTFTAQLISILEKALAAQIKKPRRAKSASKAAVAGATT